MAEFCYSCVLEEGMTEDDACRNDFVDCDSRPELVWELCEGCGNHLFDRNGKRHCSAKSWYEDQENMNLFDYPDCHNFVGLLIFTGLIDD